MAAPAVSPAEVRSVLRLLLRAVARHVTPVTGNQLWRREVLTHFRRPSPQHPAPPQPGASATAPGIQPTPASSGSSAAHQPAATGGEQAAGAGDSLSTQQALALARDWAALANNIAHHRELLTSYNIGLDVDERTKRMVEATAKRMGFALPKPAADAAPKP